MELKSLRVLEVGSSLGFFLEACEEYGIAAERCDIAERAVRYANWEKKRVHLGTLDAYYKNERFHAIFAFNLVEHLTHSNDFFTEAHIVLKPGRILVLEIPVKESLFHLLARTGYLFSKGQLNFFALYPGGHIYKFSEKTFKFICEKMGFKCVYKRKINSPFRELWAKSFIRHFNYGLIYKLSLPIVWILAKLTGEGNRLFIILQA